MLRLALIAVLTSTAAAEPQQLGVNAHAGLGTPLGFAGASVEYSPAAWFSVEAGIGHGLAGTQLAVQPRARISRLGPLGFLAVGAGVSGGPYEQRDPFYGIEYDATRYRYATWADAEISFERRTADGVLLRLYTGGAVMVHGALSSCTVGDMLAPCSGSRRGTLLPYLGVSVGYAFAHW